MDLVALKSPCTNPQWLTSDNCSVWGMWFQGTALRVRKHKNGEEKGNRGMYTELAITWMTRSLILHKPNASQNHSLHKVKRKHLSASFPGGSESACNARDTDSILGSRRSPGERNGNPLLHSCLENFMERGAWRATIIGITKLDTTERQTLSLSLPHWWRLSHRALTSLDFLVTRAWILRGLCDI